MFNKLRNDRCGPLRWCVCVSALCMYVCAVVWVLVAREIGPRISRNLSCNHKCRGWVLAHSLSGVWLGINACAWVCVCMCVCAHQRDVFTQHTLSVSCFLLCAFCSSPIPPFWFSSWTKRGPTARPPTWALPPHGYFCLSSPSKYVLS